jgi:hypothetical protein
MARHPVLRPGDTVRLRGETCTVAALDSATVRLAGVTGAVTEIPTAGLLADPGLELVMRPGADSAAAGLGPTARGDGGAGALVGAAPDRGDHRSAARTARQAPGPARPTTRPGGRCASGSWPSTRNWPWRGTGSG